MSKVIKLPGNIGQIGLIFDRFGNALHLGGLAFNTNLQVMKLAGGKQPVPMVKAMNLTRWQKFWTPRQDLNNPLIDLGSGVVTNVGVLALANDFNWPNPTTAINTLKGQNYHITGTGTNAEAATDIKLQTISTNGGQTPTAGTQSLVSAANSQKYRTVATIAYTGAETVAEWGLTNSSTLTATTGTPFTAGSATTGTVTGTPLTASTSSIQGHTQLVFENTGNATPSWGLVLSNTTSIVTVPAWYKVSDGTTGANPANTDAYTIRGVMWDRRKFTGIGVANGDSIQFTYTLTISSGG